VLAGAAFTGTLVYAVSRDGYLAVLDAADGRVLETVYINDQNKSGSEYSFSSPTIASGRVFVGSETGGLRCLRGEEQ
jgi:outer membrane protein assembly factor BamB